MRISLLAGCQSTKSPPTRATFRLALFVVALSGTLAAEGELPAFPGAEGFGAKTPGGRGGQVIEVTTLDDAGPGSLRAACEAKGPRIVVFRSGGMIEVERYDCGRVEKANS